MTADREPLDDTTLESLQGADLYNALMIRVLFELLVKSGAVDTTLLIERVREISETLRRNAPIPGEADRYKSTSDKLIEDIRIWHAQGP